MANRPAPALVLREGDREGAVPVDSVEFGACGVGTVGGDRAVGGGWGVEHGDRRVVWVSREQVTRAYPEGELHLVMDNYAAHKHPNVKKWLGDNPRVVVHFTPTHASWMNLVEVWFS
jgi:hypothetical protein